MIIPIIVTLVIVVVVFFASRKWYKNLIAQYPSPAQQIAKANKVPDNYDVEHWTGSLSIASQRYAMKEFCSQKGYDYSPPTNFYDMGSCLYNQETCISDSNPHWVSCSYTGGTYVTPDGVPCDHNQNPYLEWHTTSEGKGICTTSKFPPGFITGLCESKGLGTWHQSNLICDASGYCQINPNDIPTCNITESYCDSMGLDFKDDGGLGDCNKGDLQNILEDIFGKTVTRTTKRNAEAMIRECKDSYFSANCAKSIGTFETTFGQIGLKTADAEFKGYMTDMRNACTGPALHSVDGFSKCAMHLLPFYYFDKQIIGFTDGMLNGMIGWIPGMPHNLIGKGLGYIAKYGDIARHAIFHAGEDAIKAFDIAGDYAAMALNHIGMGPVGTIIIGAIGNIIAYGVGAAKIIMGVAAEALNIFANKLMPLVFHVFHAIVNSMLHPVQFFNSVAADLAAFENDPVGSIKKGITAIANLGTASAHAALSVLNNLKDVAGQLGGPLADDLIDMANFIDKSFTDAEKDVGKAVGAAYHAISSLF